MKAVMIFGDKNKFGVELSIDCYCISDGLMAVGKLLIYINGRKYGVDEPDATYLACSYNVIKEIVANRRRHCVPYVEDMSSSDIVSCFVWSVYAIPYGRNDWGGDFLKRLDDDLYKIGCVWAPDGDRAFDDGSHVLIFDVGEMVRLVAFVNSDDEAVISSSLEELVIDADEFYGVLRGWVTGFNDAYQSNRHLAV
ncbi:Imm42 family immunity protein [Leeia sp.]|uniref:Imm42 family immunity protein n=1 Tax=Leeia sp. TaxID=2884678 RepID=UPI0035B47764